jgi:hypothetical protein
MRSATVTVSTHVSAPPSRVWARARTMEGVNAELRPLVRMTVPKRFRGLTIDEAPVGERAFTSVVLAFGVVPFDLHFLTIAERRERGFLERSTTLVQKRWEHERTIAPEGGRAPHAWRGRWWRRSSATATSGSRVCANAGSSSRPSGGARTRR